MPSLFQGPAGKGLRHQFESLDYTDINVATSASNAVLLARVNSAARLAYIFNSLDTDLAFYLCHPNNDSSVAANRLFWQEFPAQYNLNYASNGSFWEFDPGTYIFVSKATGAGSATEGKLRITLWG